MGLRVVKNSNVRVSKKLEAPEEVGKHYRLLCLTGKNKGLVYYMLGPRLVLGRSENCDIQILDTKSSREHAEITKVGDKYVLTDLGSQNGIVVNDLKVNQHTLANGDKVIVGQTVFKYSTFINKEAQVEEEDEEDEDEEETETKGKTPANKRILIILVVLAGAFLLLGEEEQVSPVKPRTPTTGNLSGVTQGVADTSRDMDPELEKKVDTILHRGLREYREGNYYRAIEEFNLALILNPKSGRAAFYLEKAKQKLDDDVKENFNSAKKAIEALKFDSAQVSYCAILRLLEKYPEDERYTKAKRELEDLLEKMGKKKDEADCL